jgi:uncharacterized protein YkwD
MLAAVFLALTVSAGTCDFAAAQNVVNDVNAHRSVAHEGQLIVDPQLTAVAMDRAADLIRRHYFAHVSPDGTTALDALRNRSYSYGYAGENLAEAQTATAAEVALWNSPEHRDNMLEHHYSRIGVAVLRMPDQGNLIVQIFSD